MTYLSDEIRSAAERLNIPARQLDASEASETRSRIAKKFRLPPDDLLEYTELDGVLSIHDAEIWRCLGELFESEPLYLLFRLSDDAAIWRIPDGKSLVALLGESIGFVFHATPESLEFIVYFDDHDCLFGNGRAAKWIEKRRALRQGR